MISGLPPVARLALVFVAGSALVQPGARFLAPLFLLIAAAPIRASRRPDLRLLWVLSAVAGLLAGLGAHHSRERCRPAAEHGAATSLQGRLLAEGDRTRPFEAHGPSGCTGVVRVSGGDVPLGTIVTVSGRWRAWSGGFILEVDSAASPLDAPDFRARLIRRRGDLVRRIGRLFPEHGGVVAALLLARKEGLDPAVREGFARTGTAHLLAISGFHVGVVAGLLLLGLRTFRIDRRRAATLSAVGVWVYVAFIGFPAAACRAALILTAVAAARARGRPAARLGALGAALLALVVWDPMSILSPGFQLSFAGAGALAVWAPPIAAHLRTITGGKLPAAACSAVAAGVAATVGTLPIVAWHFERVSLVGIPVTLAVSPVVVVALPGALASLAVDFVAPQAGSFLAGGVSLLLESLTALVAFVARIESASVWVTRSSVVTGMAGAAAGLALVGGTRVRGRVRRLVAVLWAASAVLAWPLLEGLERRSSLEIVMIDVGQGDAIAVRTPRGRWVLIDTGPMGRSEDPGAHPGVRALRRRGVRELDLLVLTHPDLDHVGGAVPVLRSFRVKGVLDPGVPAPKAAYVAVLEAARDVGATWRIAEAGEVLDVDGVVLTVLHPGPEAAADRAPEPNDMSVVIHLRFGDFDALLTGDVPKQVERVLASSVGDGLEVLKVAHHGSNTSTDPELLERTRPEVALVSVGRANRYGHPAPVVISRLETAGTDVYRTDRDGTISVRARRDGQFRVASEGFRWR